MITDEKRSIINSIAHELAETSITSDYIKENVMCNAAEPQIHCSYQEKLILNKTKLIFHEDV